MAEKGAGTPKPWFKIPFLRNEYSDEEHEHNYLSESFGDYDEDLTYSGHPFGWTYFWYQYKKDSAHGKKLTNEEMLIKLRCHLFGEAREAIEHLDGDKYEEAITVLKEKFGKPELIEESILKHVSELPKLECDDFDELNWFTKDLEHCFMYFLKHPDRQADCSEKLVKELLLKLPEGLRRKWGKQQKLSSWTLQQFMIKLSREVGESAMRGMPPMLVNIF